MIRIRTAIALSLLTALTAFATVPSDSSTIAGPYDCDGAETTFTIPSTLGLDDDDDLDVILVTEATGAETVLTKTTHYTIAGAVTNDPQDLTAGGTVTTTTAYSSAYQILLRRNTVKTQLVNIDDEEVEEALDKLTRVTQDLSEWLGRCLYVRPSETGSTTQLSAAGTAGYLYRGAGGDISSVSSVSTGTQVIAAPWDSVLTGAPDDTDILLAKADLNLDLGCNVKDYGATGDGVTDDTDEIEAAETAAALTNTPLVFPPGVYLISDTIVVTGVKRIISGYGAILLTDSDITALQLGDDTNGFSLGTVEGLRIENGVAAGVKSTSCGILAYKDCWQLMLRDLFIGQYDAGYGFGRGVQLYDGEAIVGRLDNIWTRYCQVGVYGASNGVTIKDLYSYGGKHGIVLGQLDALNDPDEATAITTEPWGTGVTIINPCITQKSAVDPNVAYGIYTHHNADFPSVIGGYFEAIGSGSTYGKVRGTAIRVGTAVGTNHVIKGGCIVGVSFSNVAQPIEIKGTWQGGDVRGCQWRYRTSGAGFIGATNHYASGTSYVSIGQNYIGTNAAVLNPTTRIAVWSRETTNPYIGQTAKTSDYQVTLVDNLQLFTNGGATAAVDFNLPAVAGYTQFRFRKEANYPMTVSVYGTQFIQGLAAGESLEIPAIGDEVVVQAHQTTLASWVVVSSSSRQSYLNGFEDVNNVTADIVTFDTSGTNIISSNTGPIAGTLADGSATGQRVRFVCLVAGNTIDITVSKHITTSPEVIRLDAAKEAVELVWNGALWVETDVVGSVSYP